MKKPRKIKWLKAPAERNYPAAEAYLRLHFSDSAARNLIKKLRSAAVAEFAAKDILRASGLPMSEVEVFDWKVQNSEVEEGEPLSPILLVRRGEGQHVIVADGFHRLCAVFSFDQKATVMCKIV